MLSPGPGHGFCRVDGEGFKCECHQDDEESWQGSECQCTTDFACQNGGTLLDCTCYCDAHFTGDQCEIEVCNGNGIIDNESKECDCNPEWTGKGLFVELIFTFPTSSV